MSAAAVPPHPRVPVWLRPLTRRRGEVQFGVLPGGPVVTGVSDTEAALLARLDGALPFVSTERVAADAGIAPARWRALLELVAELGVLTDRLPAGVSSSGSGAAARASAPGRVVVDGCGHVATDIAEALAHAGTTVVHGRTAVDRAVAAPLRPRPDLVVLVGSPVVDPRRGDLWLRHGVPHLPVAPAGPRTVIGPLVDGSPGAPCLWCLDRHRADRDDAWPTLMSQATPTRALAPAGSPEGEHDGLVPGLSHLVVGSVTLLVNGVLEGHPPPPGVSVEVSPPWPRMDHRRWPSHPLCPAHLASGGTSGPGRAWTGTGDASLRRGA
ncbi:hypothetical protein AB4Z14_10045 [Terrabacter sp. 2TAF16]|uniref:hypothetical protein n=1 Tax=unclassified Terrabacter TaxID=2630222 RepID=UPI003F966D41